MSSTLAPENYLTVTRLDALDISQPFTYLIIESPTIAVYFLFSYYAHSLYQQPIFPNLNYQEKNTRKQSSSDRLFVERGKRLTSSNFGAVVKRRKGMYPKTLIKKVQQSKHFNCPKPCQWGKDN